MEYDWNVIHSMFLAFGGADAKGPGRTEEFHREFQELDGEYLHGVGGEEIMAKLHTGDTESLGNLSGRSVKSGGGKSRSQQGWMCGQRGTRAWENTERGPDLSAFLVENLRILTLIWDFGRIADSGDQRPPERAGAG